MCLTKSLSVYSKVSLNSSTEHKYSTDSAVNSSSESPDEYFLGTPTKIVNIRFDQWKLAKQVAKSFK